LHVAPEHGRDELADEVPQASDRPLLPPQRPAEVEVVTEGEHRDVSGDVPVPDRQVVPDGRSTRGERADPAEPTERHPTYGRRNRGSAALERVRDLSEGRLRTAGLAVEKQHPL